MFCQRRLLQQVAKFSSHIQLSQLYSHPLHNFVNASRKVASTRSAICNACRYHTVLSPHSMGKIFPVNAYQIRFFCSTPDIKNKEVEAAPKTGTDFSTEAKSIFVRFKQAYKTHGKVLIAVHIVTSLVWFGGFYYLIYSGLDVPQLLEKYASWVSESILNQLKKPGVGPVAAAYLLYKIFTPLRYSVTLFGTHYTVRFLRYWGRIPHVKEEDKLRNLAKEGRDKYSDKIDEYKGVASEIMRRKSKS